MGTRSSHGLAASLSTVLCLCSGEAGADTTTVFVQFDEQHLMAGDLDDAPNAISWTLSWFGVNEVTIPAFAAGPGQNRDQLMAAILQRVEHQWAEVDVEFVIERPTSGDFLMVTMGGSGSLVKLGGAGGWGIVDCYDENKTAVAFVFSDALRAGDDTLDSTVLAQVVSQEVAHTVGLEHLGADESLIMFPSTTDATEHVFGARCLEIVNPIRNPDHPEYCLDHPGCPMGEQNDLAHLVTYLGPALPPGGSDSSTGGPDDPTDGTEGSTSADGGETLAGDGSTTTETDSGDTSGSGSDETGGGPDGNVPEPCGCQSTTPAGGTVVLLLAGIVRRRRQSHDRR